MDRAAGCDAIIYWDFPHINKYFVYMDFGPFKCIVFSGLLSYVTLLSVSAHSVHIVVVTARVNGFDITAGHGRKVDERRSFLVI